MRRRRAL